MEHNHSHNKTQSRGFTLMETMVVVGIIMILLAIGIPSLLALRKNLRQKELDSKAQIIYVAAQNRIAELQAAGYKSLYLYDSGSTNGVHQLGYLPQDSDDEDLQPDTLCYVLSQDKELTGRAAGELLPRSSVDAELWDNHWRIEYNPLSGSIYGVFYSEAGEIPSEVNALRLKKGRLNAGAKVGYYGGDSVQVDNVDTLTPDISIENAEKLIATFYCNNPTGDALTFDITLSDGKNTYVKTVPYDQLTQLSSKTYSYTWILDSLDSDKTRFHSQTEDKLLCGTELTVKLTVTSANSLVDQKSISRKTNSLFAYRQDVADSGNTAYLAYARHLQNLDRASKVTSAIQNAVQVSDITFLDDPANDRDWYSYYSDMPFTPIENSNLSSYDGHFVVGETGLYSSIIGLHVANQGTKNAGMFRKISGTSALYSLKNITLTGTRIDGGYYVGALAGTVEGNLSMTNCRVYLSAKDGDLTNLPAASEPGNVQSWIRGTVAGGLIGRYAGSGSIQNSMAATVVEATENAGGLIGTAYGSIRLDYVYADCYLKADVTGGIVGGSEYDSSLCLVNFYAVGYQTATSLAAGLFPGKLDKETQSGYTAFQYDRSRDPAVYSTGMAINGTSLHQNVYYLTSLSDNETTTHLSGSNGMSYQNLCSQDTAAKLGEAFTLSSGDATFPYNLLNQGLTYYTYPRLTAMNHYGDWPAEFQSDALVYYEVYKDGSYGFHGANLSSLRSTEEAVGDGYALAFLDRPGTGWSGKITYAGGKTLTVDSGNTVQVSHQGKTYYLIPLPTEITNSGYTGTGFYQKITVNDTPYYFNPYFAKTVTVNDTEPAPPETIYLRTARQFHALSRYYPVYAAATSKSTFLQELDLDYTTYQWDAYAGFSKPDWQAPVNGESGFVAEYNGGGHEISGISIRSSDSAIGLFGHVADTARIQNLFLVARQGETVSYINGAGGNAASGGRTHMGALAGYVTGTIRNCAVSGYRMTYYGYRSNVLSLGGLVGTNYGSIRNCTAESPSIQTANTNSTAYVGGLVGTNRASVTSCYALGSIRVLDARNSQVWIGGFAGDNNGGALRRCYSATALTASGTAESYGLTRSGGGAVNCYYLDGGTYSYMGELYAYSAGTNDFKDQASGRAVSGRELEALTLADFGSAQESRTYNHKETEDAVYPYPAVVKAGGQFLHYGNWPVQKDIGTLGVFYWEYESGGSNAGYHLSYVGTSQGSEIGSDGVDPLNGNSLCTEHDDGGIVTSYGYGYFFQNAVDSAAIAFSTDSYCNLGTENREAGRALGQQMPGYTFIAYETGSGSSLLHLSGPRANSTWTLSYGDRASYSYTICPFFANAISLDSMSVFKGTSTETTRTRASRPGAEANQYEIRSIAQLQYINWNYGTLSADHSITSNVNSDSSRSKYPYLAYSEPPHADLASKDKNLFWKQSHDVDSYLEKGSDYTEGGSGLFTPIGSMYDNAASMNDANSNPYSAYFDSSYDGQAYVIKNIEIRGTAQCLGLFGITSGASLRNIILYSDQGNRVWNLPTGSNWYCVGGLVGLAGSRNDDGSVFENCTVSGYAILDQRSKGSENLNSSNPSAWNFNPYTPGWGGGCVGGLVGATNMNITRCTATTDITLDIGYWIGYMNLRVGGIAGVCRGSVESCYAGGSIVSPKKSKWHPNSDFTSSTSIWVGGLVGGIVMRDQGSLMKLIGEVNQELHVRNCYSFVDVPAWDNDTWVMGSYSIASNGEMQHSFKLVDNPVIYMENCYSLISTAAKSEDYRHRSNTTNWNMWNLNAWERDKGGNPSRAMYIVNSRSPYLTSEEMKTNLLGYLGGSFGTVTTTEHGAVIDGKYSFPGLDAALQGLNYPFPTILTQTDVFGNTVNVHYGSWPHAGLLWETSSASLDLLANRAAGAQDTEITLKLYLEGISASGTPSITFLDSQENPISPETAPAELVSIAPPSGAQGYYTVTLRGRKVGETVILASLNGSQAKLSLTVTANLQLSAAQTNLSVYEGESEQVILSVSDAAGKLLPEDAVLTWDLTVDNNGAAQAVVECDKADIVRQADGTYALPVSGFAAGEAVIKVTCSYSLSTSAGPVEMTSTLYLSATTKASDVLGLAANGTFQQISLPHTPKDGAYTGRGTASGPAFETPIYLYATRDYTDPQTFTPTLADIALTYEGTVYRFGADGFTQDKAFRLQLGAWSEGETASFLPLILETGRTGTAELQVTLQQGTRSTYTLRAAMALTPTEYPVHLLDREENVLLTKNIVYGETPALTQEELMPLLPAGSDLTPDSWDLSQPVYGETSLSPRAPDSNEPTEPSTTEPSSAMDSITESVPETT